MRDTPPDLPSLPSAFPGELMIWLSASFPVGGFAYSQGLELAVDRGWAADRHTLTNWLGAVLCHGSLRNDVILLSRIMRAVDADEVGELIELSSALQPSAERAAEALQQGCSFRDAYEAAWAQGETAPLWARELTLPAALALAAREHDLPVVPTLEAYAIAFCTNLVSAAIRLSVIGQFDGQRVMSSLLPKIREQSAHAGGASLDDIGSATFRADLASMLHETQNTRLFRS